MLFGPQDLQFSRAWITEDTSLGVQGEMKKEFRLGFAKYDSGDLGVLGIVFVISFAAFVKKWLHSFAIFPGFGSLRCP